MKSLLFTALLLFSTFSAQAEDVVSTHWGTGDGSESNPYIITSPEGFADLATSVNSGEKFTGKFFQLGGDIEYTSDGVTSNHTSIGDGDYRHIFCGTLDGKGHTVSGIYINATTSYQGLVGYLGEGGVVKDLTLDNSFIGGSGTVGGIVGQNKGGTVSNCHVKNTQICCTTSGSNFGGIVGYSSSHSIIENCTSQVSIRFADGVTGCRAIGGIVGNNGNQVNNNFAYGFSTENLTDISYYGAIAGLKQELSTFSGNLYADCLVDGASTNVGVNKWDLDGTASAHRISSENGLVTGAPIGITYEGTDYFAHGANITLSYNGEVPEGYMPVFSVSDANGQSVALNDDGTLTMPACDVNVTVSIEVAPWAGSGTGTDPYIIANSGQFDLLAKRVVEDDEGFIRTFFKLANDISVTTKVGLYRDVGVLHSFRGNFDGGGHTLTVNYDTDEDYCAPFPYIYTAHIHDLTVEGEIRTSKQYAAGLAAYASEADTLTNIIVNVDIISTTVEEGIHGGLVASLENSDMTISNCAFIGTIQGTGTHSCGGFVGKLRDSSTHELNINDCLFAPRSVNVSGEGSGTFIGDDSGYEACYFDRAYFTAPLGEPQGQQVYHTAEEANSNTATGKSKEIAVCGITFYLPLYFEGEGTEASPYLIKTTDDLDRVAHRVNDGISDRMGEYYKVVEDITYTYDENTKTNYTPIGGSRYEFLGTFDGDNKTISGIRVDMREEEDEDSAYYKGLFGSAGDGATVKNVILGNSIIYATDAVGGIVGWMSACTIENCHVLSSVKLIGTGELPECFGGIVGVAFDSEAVVSGCTSAAEILNVNSNAGGIVGEISSLSGITMDHCLFYGPAPDGQNVIGMMIGDDDDFPYKAFKCNYFTTMDREKEYCDVDEYSYLGIMCVLEDEEDNSCGLEMLAHLPQAAGPYDITLAYRTFYRDGSWNTLCLPFALTAEQIASSDLRGADIRTLTGSSFSGGTLTLEFSTSSLTSIEAGKPYLVRWTDYEGEEVELEDPNFYGIKVDGTEATPIETTWVNFVGSYSLETLEAGNRNVLYLGDNNTLYYPSKEVEVGACRAYFELNGLTAGELADLAPIRLNFGEEEMGIREMEDGRGKMDDAWFSIDGRRIDGKPTQKGLYIYNGRKVIK